MCSMQWSFFHLLEIDFMLQSWVVLWRTFNLHFELLFQTWPIVYDRNNWFSEQSKCFTEQRKRFTLYVSVQILRGSWSHRSFLHCNTQRHPRLSYLYKHPSIHIWYRIRWRSEELKVSQFRKLRAQEGQQKRRWRDGESSS